jgi:hypothetical protein
MMDGTSLKSAKNKNKKSSLDFTSIYRIGVSILKNDRFLKNFIL